MNENTPSNWERATIEKVLLQTIKEQRAARRWSVFFKLVVFGYIAVSLFSLGPQIRGYAGNKKPVTAVIEINGPIMSSSIANAKKINELLDQAFANKNAKGIILSINSPGGTPVNANLISSKIDRLRKKYPDKKIVAVIGEVGASGAYWVASSAEDIYADAASVVGSVGVVIQSFGFTEAIEKLGIERRIYAAGDDKVILDPFSPTNAKQQQIIEEQLNTVHELFIAQVKHGRQGRLKNAPDLFSGRIWLGKNALKVGLIDGLGDVESIAQDVIGVSEILEYTAQESLYEKFGLNVWQSFKLQAQKLSSYIFSMFYI